MALQKFTDDMHIIAKLDDEPNDVGGLTATELKAKFDEGGVALQRYINETMLPQLETMGVEQAVLLPENAGGFKYMRLNGDKVLEVSADGSTWQATGSSGHLIFDKYGKQMPQRSRTKFANSEVTDDGTYTIVQGVKDVNGVTPDTDGNITLSAGSVGAVGYNTPQALTDAQKALRSADTTGAITATTGLDGTADGQYKWVSAALRLENTVAVRIRFAAPSLEGLTVKVTMNGRTVTYTADNITDEGEGYFNNIGAGEYGDTVTAIMEKDGAQIAETLTYSVAAYIREAVNKESTTEKTLALVRALWSYGESAKAVSAS